MTVAQKVFWFFGICLVGNIALSMVGGTPVPDMSREAQCKTSKWYVRYWTYDGRPVAKDTIQCFNDLVIRTEKM